MNSGFRLNAAGGGLLFVLSVFALLTSTRLVAAQDVAYVLRLTELGQQSTVRLSGAIAERTYTIPVPDGYKPATFETQIYTVPGISSGLLVFENEGTTLASLQLPLTQKKLLVPLTQAIVQRGRMNLTIRAVINPGQDRCAANLVQWVELSDMAINFEGTLRPPTTLAEFWPADLRELRIYYSPNPDRATSEATLNLSAFASRLGVGHPVTVTAQPLDASQVPPDLKPDPFSRVIVIQGNDGPAEQRLVAPGQNKWPFLLIAGSPQSFPAAVEAMTGLTRPLLVSPSTNLTAINLPPVPVNNQRTFEELGYPQIQMQGAGQLETNLSFSQADLGGPLSDVGVRLVGTYSPIPSGGVASIALLLNGGLIQATTLEKSGNFDIFSQLPGSLLRRDNNLTMRVLYTPPGGECRVGVHDLIVRIDGGSYLQGQYGQKLAPGFERFPQVLLPEFDVAFDQPTPEAMQSTSTIVAALQRLTRTPLKAKVVTWEQASAPQNSRPLLAVAIDSRRTEILQPPLNPQPFRLLDTDSRELLRLDIDARFTVLEAYTRQERNLLLLTHRDLTQNLVAFTNLLNQKTGWYDLTGDLWIQPAGQPAYNVRLRGSGLRAQPIAANIPTWWDGYTWVLYVVAFMLIIAFLFWAYPRVVRKGPTK